MEQSIPYIRQEFMWELQFERQITLRNHGESLLVRSNVSAELWICPVQRRDRDGWSWCWLESVCWIVGECLLVLRLSAGSVGSVIIPMKLLLTFRQL